MQTITFPLPLENLHLVEEEAKVQRQVQVPNSALPMAEIHLNLQAP